MASSAGITVTPVDSGPFTKTWDITSAQDGDTTAQFAHGFVNHYTPVAPAVVILVPENVKFYTHEWTLGVVDTVNINVNCISATGAGLSGTPQLRVVAQLPNSIVE